MDTTKERPYRIAIEILDKEFLELDVDDIHVTDSWCCFMLDGEQTCYNVRNIVCVSVKQNENKDGSKGKEGKVLYIVPDTNSDPNTKH